MSNSKQQSFGAQPRETEGRSAEEGEIIETLSQDAGEESDIDYGRDVAGMREIVQALPAMSIREAYVGDEDNDKNDDDEEKNATSDAAIVVAAAAEAEAAAKGKGKKILKGEDVASGSGGGRAAGDKRRVKLVIKDSTGVGESGLGEAKKKKKAAELTNPPAGEPSCPICDKKFASFKAVFGHQRAHKDRQHRGFLPPPKFTPPSSPRGQADDLATTSGAAGGTSEAFSSGGGELRFDLNAPPAEESSGFGRVADFDLNKTPPKEDLDEE